ncbi:hypothetical protein OCU04_009849 [Sclerotinia nivalis]|uniref:Uncharacterized protein n=1 Tax=Sclerotinia nivalis TaxID=352851 RepID=A0A9X0DGX7_9HELO|nr:hypothetical protein OCU04_009849 [Sclerotinia nivalis]
MSFSIMFAPHLLTHHHHINTSTHSNIQLSTSTFTMQAFRKSLRYSANIFNQHTEQTHTSSAMSEVSCFPFATLDDWCFVREMTHYFHKVGWDSSMPNPRVPFPNQPTFVVQFQFWASLLEGHIKDPEPYLPGQVYGFHGSHGPTLEEALFEAFRKNGITNCTIDYGSEETMSWEGHPQHVLCRGFPPIHPYDGSLQDPMRLGGGYDVKTEPWIPLWQIDAHGAQTEWKPMNLQRYQVSCMQVISPVLPLTEESYQEVDRVADTICQTLRVQKEDGPGIEVRCESRSNFQWSSTQHRVPENLKQTLEKRFSRIPQVDQEKRLAYAHEMFNELVTTGPQPRGW